MDQIYAFTPDRINPRLFFAFAALGNELVFGVDVSNVLADVQVSCTGTLPTD